MKRSVITWASGEDFCRSEGFSCYVNSLKNIKDADFFVFTHDMPAAINEQLVTRGIRVVHFPPEKIKYLLRDRHLVYWEFMVENVNTYEYFLITDSKDVIFQRNPFEYVQSWWFEFVLLAGEGMTHSQSGWNLIDQFETQKNVREFEQEYRDWPVVNGGVLLGTTEKLKNLLFLLWSNTVRSIGKCTDQGVLNYLYSFLEREGSFHLRDPHKDNYCLTGEAVKEGFIAPSFKEGTLCHPLTQSPYYIVHQWERTQYREQILSQFSK